jgi:hypothetical protein
MDNFGEISPNLVVLSAVDFPKHWKVFVQYVSFVYATTCDIVLIVDKKFDAGEKEKAHALGVWKTLSESKLHKFVGAAAAGMMNFIDVVNDGDNASDEAVTEPPKKTPPASVDTARLDAQFEEALEEQERLLDIERDALPPADGTPEDSVQAETAPKSGGMTEEEMSALAAALEPPNTDFSETRFLFRHPKTGAPVPGTVESVTISSIIFKPDSQAVIGTFQNGDLVKSASLKNSGTVSTVDAYVMPWDDTLHFTLIPNEDNEPAAGNGEPAEADKPSQEADASAEAPAEAPEADPSETQFMFRHPRTNALVTGTAETATDSSVVFRPDFQETLSSLEDGELIQSASFKNGESLSLVDARVTARQDGALRFTLAREKP